MRKLLLLLGFLSLASVASATPSPTNTPPPKWTCVIKGDLRGDVRFHWSTGYDAWEGDGQIDCVSGTEVLRVDTLVRFESSSLQSVGSTQNSSIVFTSRPIITRRPYDLTQRLNVYSVISQVGNSIWRSLRTQPSMIFLLQADPEKKFHTSLANGTLEIFLKELAPSTGI